MCLLVSAWFSFPIKCRLQHSNVERLRGDKAKEPPPWKHLKYLCSLTLPSPPLGHATLQAALESPNCKLVLFTSSAIFVTLRNTAFHCYFCKMPLKWPYSHYLDVYKVCVLEPVLNKSIFHCYQVHLNQNHTFFYRSYLRFIS